MLPKAFFAIVLVNCALSPMLGAQSPEAAISLAVPQEAKTFLPATIDATEMVPLSNPAQTMPVPELGVFRLTAIGLGLLVAAQRFSRRRSR